MKKMLRSFFTVRIFPKSKSKNRRRLFCGRREIGVLIFCPIPTTYLAPPFVPRQLIFLSKEEEEHGGKRSDFFWQMESMCGGGGWWVVAVARGRLWLAQRSRENEEEDEGGGRQLDRRFAYMEKGRGATVCWSVFSFFCPRYGFRQLVMYIKIQKAKFWTKFSQRF